MLCSRLIPADISLLPFQTNLAVLYLSTVGPFVWVYVVLVPLLHIAKNIVLEKEAGIKVGHDAISPPEKRDSAFSVPLVAHLSLSPPFRLI